MEYYSKYAFVFFSVPRPPAGGGGGPRQTRIKRHSEEGGKVSKNGDFPYTVY